MDEKERQDIELRGLERATHTVDDYIQGALDQDPISRKKRTEEIKEELISKCYKLPYATFYSREEFINLIQQTLS